MASEILGVEGSNVASALPTALSLLPTPTRGKEPCENR